nr:hypothetical protein [Tanacetum cinerariifolium]
MSKNHDKIEESAMTGRMVLEVTALNLLAVPPLPPPTIDLWMIIGFKIQRLSKYDKGKKCGVYGFTNDELPSEYYNQLSYNLHMENKELRTISSSLLDPVPLDEFEMGASNSRVIFNDGFNVGRFNFNKKNKFGSSSTGHVKMRGRKTKGDRLMPAQSLQAYFKPSRNTTITGCKSGRYEEFKSSTKKPNKIFGCSAKK